MQKWEYVTCTKRDLPAVEVALQEHGNEGWELASLVHQMVNYLLVFKRPKP